MPAEAAAYKGPRDRQVQCAGQASKRKPHVERPSYIPALFADSLIAEAGERRQDSAPDRRDAGTGTGLEPFC